MAQTTLVWPILDIDFVPSDLLSFLANISQGKVFYFYQSYCQWHSTWRNSLWELYTLGRTNLFKWDVCVYGLYQTEKRTRISSLPEFPLARNPLSGVILYSAFRCFQVQSFIPENQDYACLFG